MSEQYWVAEHYETPVGTSAPIWPIAHAQMSVNLSSVFSPELSPAVDPHFLLPARTHCISETSPVGHWRILLHSGNWRPTPRGWWPLCIRYWYTNNSDVHA